MKTKIHSLFLMLAILAGVHQAAAQETVFTYQGQVQDNGTNFTGMGQFKFALVTSTNINGQATATAIMGGSSPHEFVESFNLTYGGSGYVTAPSVTITGGGGSGASAQATISGGVVNGMSIISPGSGYTSTPTVTIAAPPPDITYTTCWSSDGTSVNGSQPAAAVSVAVSSGLFTVVLGDTTVANMTNLEASVFGQPNLQLRIWFNDGVNGFAALSPLQDLTAAPYAIQALNASSASNLLGRLPVAQLGGTVGNAQLANNSITVSAGTGLSGGGSVALGGATSLTNAGVLSVTGNADITASTTGGAVTLGTTATDSDSSSTIVKRDSSGNFSASTINLSGSLNFWNAGYNTAVGVNAGTNGQNNTAIGWDALFANTTGSWNVATGFDALEHNTNGCYDTADGYGALYNNTTGYSNTAIGFGALAGITTGVNNIAVGSSSGNKLVTEHNNIDIGNMGVSGESGAIRIGQSGAQISTYIAGIYNATVSGTVVQVSSSGQLGVSSSSRIFKQDIQSMADTSDELLALRPVTFKYKPEIEPQGLPQFGLIAEEVEQVDPNLVIHDKEHGIYTVRYEAVNAMLLNEFLKEHRAVEAQETAIQGLNRKLEEQAKDKDAEIQALQQSVADLKKMVQILAGKK